MTTVTAADRLADWLATKISKAEAVTLSKFDNPADGHSSQTILTTATWHDPDGPHTQDLVVRVRPPSPCLIEPYDIGRQYEILRRLEPTDVKSPRVLWLESSGDVLGREFYVMERLGGEVSEMAPEGAEPARIRRMCESMLDQIAAIHNVDIEATGLAQLGVDGDYLEHELARWTGEVDRVKQSPLPALEQLADVLRQRRPQTSPRICLIHGDAKPGNFAFDGSDVSAVFDWEMAAVGDPLTDIGWIEYMFGSFMTVPGAPSWDELLSRYEDLTKVTVRDREWYRALAKFKLAAILLVGKTLFDEGHTDDLMLGFAAHLIHPLTEQALGDLGIDDTLDSGPVLPDPDRVAAVQALQEGKDA